MYSSSMSREKTRLIQYVAASFRGSCNYTVLHALSFSRERNRNMHRHARLQEDHNGSQ